VGGEPDGGTRGYGRASSTRLNLAGPGCTPVPAHELASRKGRMLLKLLVARRGAVVPAVVVAEALWGDRPPADPDANLATLVSRLRSVLGATARA
jgi:DNA-binding SARP family transcriptional activator